MMRINEIPKKVVSLEQVFVWMLKGKSFSEWFVGF